MVDIITNSRDGRIQVFWGGKGQSGDNFLSKDQSHCDSEWEKRQTSTLVTHFGVEISLDDMVHDASLIHWK